MISLVNIHKFNPMDYDVTYAIMRSYTPSGKDFCVFQKSELSPSYNLFMWYRDLASKGAWTREAFSDIYVPRFIDEIVHNTEALKALSFLYRMSASGAHVALGCTCYDETMCHRSIVGGILQGCGADVQGQRYTEYFDLYQEALQCK